MKADVSEIGYAKGQLITALPVLLASGNTAEFTRDTESIVLTEED